jgi:Heterokaryon incompatibility protein (HET)
MATLAETKTFLMASDSEWRKHIYFRLMARSLDAYDPETPPSAPCYSTRGRRKSIDFDSRRMQRYKYRPLPSSTSIRLLQFMGIDDEHGWFLAVLKMVDINDAEYAALSYTWGPPNDGWDNLTPAQKFSTRYNLVVVEEDIYNKILLDKLNAPQLSNQALIPLDELFSIAIGQNLSDFLQSFAGLETNSKTPAILYPIWIDAICINQADPIEKGAQISLMGDIYSNASLVFAWLGKAPAQFDTVLWMNDCFLGSLMQRCPPDISWEDHLQMINRGDPKSAGFWLYCTGLQPREEDWATCWDILLRFLRDTRWFRRCWILQEFCLARDCLFICGSAVFRPNFECLAFLRSAILSIEHFHNKSYNLATTLRLFELRREINPWINRSDSILPPQKIHMHVGRCLHWTRSRDVSLEADRVYSIIGIMKRLLDQAIPLVLPSPNLPDQDIFTWAATWLLENGPELSLLSLVEPWKSANRLRMPSWVPNLSVRLEYEAPIVDFAHLGFNATLSDKSRSRPPRLEVQGNVLRSSGRQIGQVYKYLGLLALLATASIFVESEWYESWLVESMPSAEAETLKIFAVITRQFMTYFVYAKLGANDHQQFCEMKQQLLENPKQMEEVSNFAKEFFEAGAFDDGLLASDMTVPGVLINDFGGQHSILQRQELLVSRCPFITWNGRTGFGPSSMKLNDEIWLLEGGRVPYILRKDPQNNYFTFVGECLVFGVMRGELMTDEFRAGFRIIEIL